MNKEDCSRKCDRLKEFQNAINQHEDWLVTPAMKKMRSQAGQQT
jgi:hypothetical protein